MKSYDKSKKFFLLFSRKIDMLLEIGCQKC